MLKDTSASLVDVDKIDRRTTRLVQRSQMKWSKARKKIERQIINTRVNNDRFVQELTKNVN